MYCLYETTNLINDKIYVGATIFDKVEGGYRGSGVILAKAVKKYGKENFVTEPFMLFADAESAFNMERQLVDKEFINRPDTYNARVGGLGMAAGEDHPFYGIRGEDHPLYGVPKSEEARKKQSEAMKGRPGLRGEANPNYGKSPSDETRKKMSKAGRGRPKSTDHRRKIGEANSRRVWKDESRQKLSESQSGENSPWWGKTHSEETLEKMSEGKKGEKNPMYGRKMERFICEHCGKDTVKSSLNRAHGIGKCVGRGFKGKTRSG